MRKTEVIKGQIIAETHLAVLVLMDRPKNARIWFPRRLCAGGFSLRVGSRDPELIKNRRRQNV